MRTLVILTLLGLVPFSSPQQRAANKVPPRPSAGVAMQQLQADLASALNERDAAKLASLFGPDADFVPIAGPLAHGRAAVQAAWQHLFDLDARDFSLTLTTSASANGEVGYQFGHLAGTYELTRPDGPERKREKGRYLAGVIRLNQEKWEIHQAMFRPETP